MAELSLKEKFPAAFPKLSPPQIAEVAKVAECRTYKNGDILLKAGDTKFKFHVIQKGEIEIIDRTGNEPKVIVTHEPLEFTGDIANLAGRASNVDAVAKGTVEVYEICSKELKIIINERPDLSDTILKAFIERSRVLSESNFTGLRVIGSAFRRILFASGIFFQKIVYCLHGLMLKMIRMWAIFFSALM